jgi:hypothetical protein
VLSWTYSFVEDRGVHGSIEGYQPNMTWRQVCHECVERDSDWSQDVASLSRVASCY